MLLSLTVEYEKPSYKPMKPTDYGTSWYINRCMRLGGTGGSSAGAAPSHDWDSSAWSLIEIRRQQEHREIMSELRSQSNMMARSSGKSCTDGGLIDTIWKGRW